MSWRRENPDYDALDKLIYEIDELGDIRGKHVWTSGRKVLDGYFVKLGLPELVVCGLRLRNSE